MIPRFTARRCETLACGSKGQAPDIRCLTFGTPGGCRETRETLAWPSLPGLARPRCEPPGDGSDRQAPHTRCFPFGSPCLALAPPKTLATPRLPRQARPSRGLPLRQFRKSRTGYPVLGSGNHRREPRNEGPGAPGYPAVGLASPPVFPDSLPRCPKSRTGYLLLDLELPVASPQNSRGGPGFLAVALPLTVFSLERVGNGMARSPHSQC